MKRFLSLLLSICIVVGITTTVPFSVSGAEIEDSDINIENKPLYSCAPIYATGSGAISVTRDASTSQTITYSIDSGTTTYYWGTNEDYKKNTPTNPSSSITSVSKSITAPGSYYMTTYKEIIGASGTLAGTVTSTYNTVTFYKVSLDANGGSVGLPYVLASDYGWENTTLPTPTRSGYEFKGWATSTNAKSGVFSVCPESDSTYYAIWKDNTLPTGSITSTNNLSDLQTVTLSLSDNDEVAGYYWGTSSSYSNNIYTSTSSSSVSENVSEAGTYYLTVKDTSGNVSTSQSVTFYETKLNANGGTVYPTSVLTMSGSSFYLPTPTRSGYTFTGWSTNKLATGGEKYSITPNCSNTYFAIWKMDDAIDQTISLLSTSYIKTYGDKPFNLNASAMTDLQYKSSNTKVATVSSNGTVTIKGSGSATITITAVSDEQYNSAEKTVNITVNKGSQKITAKSYTKTNGSKAFRLGAKTSGDGKLTYTTSNKNIATVSSKGIVTIKGCGKATITIKASTTSKYKSASKKVYITVLPSTVKIKSITGKGKTTRITFNKQKGLSGYVAEISRKSNFSFKASNILKGNRRDCSFNGCLAGKKYYVRIRAFVKIASKTYYSKWTTKSVVVKK